MESEIHCFKIEPELLRVLLLLSNLLLLLIPKPRLLLLQLLLRHPGLILPPLILLLFLGVLQAKFGEGDGFRILVLLNILRLILRNGLQIQLLLRLAGGVIH